VTGLSPAGVLPLQAARSVANFQRHTICWNTEETKPQYIVDNKLLLPTLRQSQQRMPIKDLTVLERHLAALRKAGLK
jgi:hypothetical protein